MGKLEIEGWPTVYKYRYFKEGDIVRNINSGRLGVVLNEAPNSTYPGDISVASIESNFTRGYYECPDNYKLIWRDNGI